MNIYQKRKERKEKRENNSEEKVISSTGINWYPGHMVKAKREIKERIKLIDIIYECVDARMPSSSKLKGMDDILEAKPRILVMTKKDLCDLEETRSEAFRCGSGCLPRCRPVPARIQCRAPCRNHPESAADSGTGGQCTHFCPQSCRTGH